MLYWRRIVYLNNLFSPTRWVIPWPTPTTKLPANLLLPLRPIGIPREMTDKDSKFLWFGEYTAWGRLKKNERVYKDAHQPFRLQNQYFDEEIGLHYNFIRYYESEADRFVNQDPIRLLSGDNLYQFALNTQKWIDSLGLSKCDPSGKDKDKLPGSTEDNIY